MLAENTELQTSVPNKPILKLLRACCLPRTPVLFSWATGWCSGLICPKLVCSRCRTSHFPWWLHEVPAGCSLKSISCTCNLVLYVDMLWISFHFPAKNIKIVNKEEKTVNSDIGITVADLFWIFLVTFYVCPEVAFRSVCFQNCLLLFWRWLQCLPSLLCL